MKKVSMIIALVLVIAMVLGLVAMIPTALAAEEITQTYQLAELLNGGNIKPLGRTQAGGAGIRTDWSGTGFAAIMNVPEEGELTVGYVSSYETYWAVRVDGEEHWRGYAAANTSGGTFACRLPAGKHTVEVIKETQISTSQSAYCDLTTVTVPADTVITRVGDQGLYLEFIGDSYACGDGALGVYEAGSTWASKDHSATNSFSFFTAQSLNADWSIVARGGIGLLGDNAQEASSSSTLTMDQIYGLASGYRDISSGTAWSGRTPDVIVMELGANDGTSNMTAWTEKLQSFITQVQTQNPGVPIVFFAKNTVHYKAVLDLIDEGTYADLYATRFEFGGAGSAATATQKAGHPSAQEHTYIARELVKFLKQTVLKADAAQEETAYKYNYYISATGNDANDGLTPDAAKLTLRSAMTQSRIDHSTAKTAAGFVFESDASFCFNVTGTVVSGSSQALAGTDYRYCDAQGNELPIMIRAYGDNSETDGRAVLQNNYKATNNGSAVLPIYFSATFENIEISTLTNDAGTYAPYQLRLGGNNVVLDNVKFSIRGEKSTQQFYLSAAPFIPDGGDLANRVAQGDVNASLTLRNGDYSPYRISAVMGNSLWTSNGNVYEMYGLHTKIVVDAGAAVGTVRNLEGTFAVGSSTVEIREGAEVACYLGTNSGAITYKTKEVHLLISGGTVGSAAGTGNEVTIADGNVTNTITGGTILGDSFLGVGSTVTVGGNVTNHISGGHLKIGVSELTSDNNAMGIFLGGGSGVSIAGSVVNHISGGVLSVEINTALSTSSLKIDQGLYFGVKSGTVSGNLENNISGGSFLLFKEGSGAITSTGIYLGCYGATIVGDLVNTISGGVFDTSKTGYSYFLGGRGLANYVGGQIRNTVGVQNAPQDGPVFVGSGIVYLGGGWGRLNYDGAKAANSSGSYTVMPENGDAVVSETVISNTVYGGKFAGDVYCGISGNSSGNGGSSRVSYIYGSLENEIYGGRFENSLYLGSGGTNIYGNVTSHVYGGIVQSLIGGSGYAIINGDVTTNIYGLEDFASIGSTSAGYKIVAGSYHTSETYTPGAIKGALSLNICPEDYRDLELHTPIYEYSLGGSAGNGTVGTNKGLTVSAGSFPDGLTVNGAVVTETHIGADSVACGTDGVAVTDLSELLTVRPAGQEAHSIFHCVCGNLMAQSLTGAVSGDPAKCLKGGNGGCDGTILEWKPWENTTVLPNTKALLGGGAEHNFYLVNDVTMSGQASLGSGAITQETTYRLDLNGKTVCHQVSPTRVTSGDGYRVLVAFGSAATSQYDLNLVITDSSPDKTGVVTIRNVPNAAASKNYGQILWARNGDVDIYGGTLDGSNGNHDGAYAYVDGAAVRVTAGRTMNLYGGKLLGGESYKPGTDLHGGAVILNENAVLNLYNDAVIEGGVADYGGNVTVQKNATFNICGGTIQNGTARLNGGNIRVNLGGTLNVQGGTIQGGTAGDSGGNLVTYGDLNMSDGLIQNGTAAKGKAQSVFVVDNTSNDGTLTMTGGTIAGDLGVVGDGNTILKLSGNVQIPCGSDYGLNLPDNTRIDLTDGLDQTAAISVRKYNGGVFTTEDAAGYMENFTTNREGHVIAVTQTGALSLGTADAFLEVTVNGEQAYYDSLTTAASFNQGKCVQLQGDVTEDLTLTGDLYLDLNGHTLTGNISGGRFWGMDSTTDDYQAQTYGKVTGTIENLANGQGEKFTVPGTSLIRRYVAIPETDGTSFHRVYVGITSVSLQPDTVAFGYKAQFWGDDLVRSRVTGIGYNLWAGENTEPETRSVSMDATGKTLTLRLNGVLKDNDACNGEKLTTLVHAEAFMNLSVDGESFTLTSSESQLSLDAMLRQLDELLGALTDGQCTALKNMYTRFESLLSTLPLPNLAAYVIAAE